MTVSSFTGPECREIRLLLGVYVLGAIDPAERTLVDNHLGECAACRDELAGLAGLPAMLSRVPAEDVEQLSLSSLPAAAEPSEEMLDSLLSRVSAKRRSRMWRGVAAVAAAAAIAAGGTALAAHLSAPVAAHQNQAASSERVRGSNPRTHVAALVEYTPTPWGSITMRVQVSGIPQGTVCQFWVLDKQGRWYAGTWTVGVNYGQPTWYPASAPLAAQYVRSFQLTSGGHVLLTIPAS